jgi:quercetin dioxygenase-like cupin family protein
VAEALELRARLTAEGLEAGGWSNGPGDRYAAHEHAYDKVIVVTAGSIAFGLPASGAVLGLEAGDRLELPAGTAHDASVGPDGVTCLEAHRPAGSLRLAHHRAGMW